MRFLSRLERLLVVFGLLMLAIYLGVCTYTAISSRLTVESFKRQPATSLHQKNTVTLTAAKPNFSLWSPKRIKDYEDSLITYFTPAIGILRIPKIQVEVPVLDGTDELSLNRGVGRIAGTASPGEEGNLGIAGHRDGFFRGLKNISFGDTIEMDTATRTDTYIIDNVVIVDPGDTSVLQARQRPSLTLVTCYPFYFVGSAPKRYIVQASLTDRDPGTARNVERPDFPTSNRDEQTSTR
jgi:sortase A